MRDRRDYKSFACGIGDHGSCLVGEATFEFLGESYCTCSCHGNEPPTGVREPRRPVDSPPTLSALLNLPS